MKKAAIFVLAFSLSAASAFAADDSADGKASDGAQPAADKTATAALPAAPARRKVAPLWSYQPVSAPAVPATHHAKWVRTPIDAFVAAKLEENKLEPSADADRATFIRRATLDVWGVIPTPDEVNAFVKDKSPQAYEHLVDRLLDSPRYGERQARRWLDLARYADSTGFQNDNTRPNMWRYRDYVINAFNSDKPYDRFIEEQLAGDEIAPDNKEALIATGFLAGYPDNYNSRDLVQRKYQIATDMTDTVGEVFLAQTVGCARCHDHKFDKISEKEYFQLQAFFANTAEFNDIPADIGPQETAYRAQEAKWEQATSDIRAKRKAVIDSVRPAAIKYQKERYLTDSRESLFKPESEWTPADRWINHRWENVVDEEADLGGYLKDTGENPKSADYIAANAEKWAEYKKLTADLKKFDNLKPAKGSDTISAMKDLGPDSPKSYLFFTGNHERPLDEVQPAFPAAIANGAKPDIVPTATSTGRRTALAKWIASADNPLTARVFVNRVWAQYFGEGIVRTVSDFGKAGERPTHPELLDYLASTFVQDGWSVKKLHRRILLSSVYRQASTYRPEVAQADPDGKLLAVFPRRRLDAEQIRDSLLVASGDLEDQLGGPSVFPPVPKDLNAGQFWKVSKDKDDFDRRSLYIFTRRSVAYPLLATFDMASPQQAHSKRDVTTTPLQALTLVNSDIVFSWSQDLAGRVIREAGPKESAQLDRLYEILFARKPDKQEKAALVAFIDSHQQTIKAKAADGKLEIALPTGVTVAQAGDPIRASAFVDLVHTVANSNNFTYRF
ncbi:MAG: DUF1549 and DUF1553 domain-containing protein [Solimonas sp.]